MDTKIEQTRERIAEAQAKVTALQVELERVGYDPDDPAWDDIKHYREVVVFQTQVLASLTAMTS